MPWIDSVQEKYIETICVKHLESASWSGEPYNINDLIHDVQNDKKLMYAYSQQHVTLTREDVSILCKNFLFDYL